MLVPIFFCVIWTLYSPSLILWACSKLNYFRNLIWIKIAIPDSFSPKLNAFQFALYTVYMSLNQGHLWPSFPSATNTYSARIYYAYAYMWHVCKNTRKVITASIADQKTIRNKKHKEKFMYHSLHEAFREIESREGWNSRKCRPAPRTWSARKAGPCGGWRVCKKRFWDGGLWHGHDFDEIVTKFR